MLTFIIALGALLGAFDCIRGNRLGLGEKFEEGFLCLGTAALGIAGIICIAPVLGTLLKPAVVPLYHRLGMDPAMFGSLLANNMGGYPLAMELADDEQVGRFSGLVVASMLGAALVYTIPVGLGLVQEEDKEAFTRGIMIGMMAIPLGAAAGGLMMGIPVGKILWNSIPTVLVTAVLATGFVCCPARLVKGFLAAAKGIRAVSIFGLGVGAFASMTGYSLIPGMETLEHAMGIVAGMGIVQLGSIPVAALFLRFFESPLAKLGKRLSVNAVSMASFPVACVNVISVFTMVKDMDRKGIVISAAWCTNTIALFTAHLAYTKTVSPQMVTPVLVSKVVGGLAAAVIAYWMEREKEEEGQGEK